MSNQKKFLQHGESLSFEIKKDIIVFNISTKEYLCIIKDCRILRFYFSAGATINSFPLFGNF